jgi:hypothetical protein
LVRGLQASLLLTRGLGPAVPRLSGLALALTRLLVLDLLFVMRGCQRPLQMRSR